MYKRNLLQRAFLLIIFLPPSSNAFENIKLVSEESIIVSESGVKTTLIFHDVDSVKKDEYLEITNKEELILNSPKIDMGIRRKGIRNPGNVDSFSGMINQSGFVIKGVPNFSKENPLIYINEKEETLETLRKTNSEDIEKIEILKDKNATDKYGEKGKNGVIIIKLKNK